MSLKKRWWSFLNLFYVFTFCTYNDMILNIRGESIDKKYQKIKQEKFLNKSQRQNQEDETLAEIVKK